MAKELGRAVVANIIILGFLAAVSNVLSKEPLKNSILDSIPAGTEEFNIKAFDLGYDYGIEHVKKVEHRKA
jgi:2-oxoglutarate ferredoxin oxidoreductase subunit gamma